MLDQDRVRALPDERGLQGVCLRNAMGALAVLIIQLNVATLFLISAVEWVILNWDGLLERGLGLTFDKGWGIPTFLLAGFVGGFAHPLLWGSQKRLSSWLTASVPIAIVLSIFVRTEVGAKWCGFSSMLKSWPNVHVALTAAGLGAWLGVLCGLRLAEKGKRIQVDLRLAVWLAVLSLITSTLYVRLWLMPLGK